jgi:hypothetical protein
MTAGCDPISPYGPQRRVVTIVVSLQGTVVSSADNSLIGGATVSFGQGGHFSLPQIDTTVVADASGAYTLQQSVQIREGECPFWLTAAAAGFQTSNSEDSRHIVSCSGPTQTVRITLAPSGP